MSCPQPYILVDRRVPASPKWPTIYGGLIMNRTWLIMVACVLLGACATAARTERMVTGPQAGTQIAVGSPLRGSIEVADVTGGKKTSPLWKSNVGNEEFRAALIESLNMYSIGAKSGAHYKLNVNLVEMKQPVVAINSTVTSIVDYSVVDASSGDVVWQKKIQHAYTANFGESVVGFERLKKANEGSIKGNIQELVDALIAWNGSRTAAE
jgi:hypothetical protein